MVRIKDDPSNRNDSPTISVYYALVHQFGESGTQKHSFDQLLTASGFRERLSSASTKPSAGQNQQQGSNLFSAKGCLRSAGYAEMSSGYST
jgi:hypothetical protein